jgi:hypothetical protein
MMNIFLSTRTYKFSGAAVQRNRVGRTDIDLYILYYSYRAQLLIKYKFIPTNALLLFNMFLHYIAFSKMYCAHRPYNNIRLVKHS